MHTDYEICLVEKIPANFPRQIELPRRSVDDALGEFYAIMAEVCNRSDLSKPCR